MFPVVAMPGEELAKGKDPFVICLFGKDLGERHPRPQLMKYEPSADQIETLLRGAILGRCEACLVENIPSLASEAPPHAADSRLRPEDIISPHSIDIPTRGISEKKRGPHCLRIICSASH
jgi:hypothetical protein